jgi:hypothetical protein
MLNPFINDPSYRPKKHFRTENEESSFGQFAHPMVNSSKPWRWALWLGSLLIRMGRKLNEDNSLPKTNHGNI